MMETGKQFRIIYCLKKLITQKKKNKDKKI